MLRTFLVMTEDLFNIFEICLVQVKLGNCNFKNITIFFDRCYLKTYRTHRNDTTDRLSLDFVLGLVRFNNRIPSLKGRKGFVL